MPHNPVGWFEIYVQDMERAKKFYEQVFETRLERIESGIEMWAFPFEEDGKGIAGALVSVPGMPSGGNSTMVYFSCADCAVEESRVEAAGGVVHRAKSGIGDYGFVSLCRDTDGNMIGLHSRS